MEEEAKNFRQQQRRLQALAEQAAQRLPLREPFSPLQQLRAYLRKYLHPNATPADTAQLLAMHAIAAQSQHPESHFPKPFMEQAAAWASKYVDWPTRPISAPKESPSLLPLLADMPAHAHIQLPLLDDPAHFHELKAHFPKAHFTLASPLAGVASQLPNCFWGQALMEEEMYDGAIFEQVGTWENIWQALKQPRALTFASLLEFPTERFERGRGRLLDAFEEGLPASRWQTDRRKEPLARVLNFLLKRANTGETLLLLAPEALWKEPSYDFARDLMASYSSRVVLTQLDGSNCGISLSVGKEKEACIVEADGILLVQRHGDWLHPNTGKGHRLGLPFPSELPSIFKESHEANLPEGTDLHTWQAAPFLTCELPSPPAAGQNEYLCIGMRPFAVWITAHRPLPSLLPSERIKVFPRFTEGSKSNISDWALKDWAKRVKQCYPVPKGAETQQLHSLAEEMERTSKKLPVVQKYIDQIRLLADKHGAVLPFEAFSEMQEIAQQFAQKIKQLYPSANERRSMFDRLQLSVGQLQQALQEATAKIADAQAKQEIGNADGFWLALYAYLQQFERADGEMADLLHWQFPYIEWPEIGLWELRERGKWLLGQAQGMATEDVALDMLLKQVGQLEGGPSLGGKPLPKCVRDAAKRAKRVANIGEEAIAKALAQAMAYTEMPPKSGQAIIK